MTPNDDVATGGSQTILYLNLMIMGISYIIFSAIIPFIAIELTECGLSPSAIGTITAAYPFGMVISSISAGYFLPVLGTKNVLLSSIVIAAVSSILFGSVPDIACDLSDTDDPEGATEALILYLVFRMIQGLAGGAIETTVIFSNSDLFADNLGQVMAYQELSIGLACMLGPLVGGVLYDFLGFFWTFGCFSVLNGVLFVVILFFFPNKSERITTDEEKLGLLDTTINEKGVEKDELFEDEEEDVGVMDVLSFPIIIAYCSLFLFNFFFSCMMPFLALYTQAMFGWGAMLSGASVGCCALMYAMSAFGVGFKIDQLKIASTGLFKLTYGTGFTIMALAYWLLGPYPFFDAVASEASLLVGMAFLGLACGFVAIPSLPDAQFCAEKTKNDSKQVKSLVSGGWQATYAFASVVGGPVGGVIFGQWGFVGVNFFCAVISLCMAVFTFLLGAYWCKFNPFPTKNSF